MASAEAVDECLATIEKALVKLRAAQGSAVKLQRAETDMLGCLQKVRDLFMACVQDRDRTKLIQTFGGDCMRIAKFRGILQAVELSEKSKDDQRLPGSLSACSLIEEILREREHGKMLKEAQEHCIPWRPPGEKQAEPAAAPAPAAKAAPQEAKPTLQAPQSTTQTIVTSEGETFKEEDETKRQIMVEISVDMKPEVNPGPKGEIVLEMSHIVVKLATTVTPPLPAGSKAFEPNQEFQLPVPDFQRVTFDPAEKTPPGARFETSVSQHAELLEIPGHIEVSVASKSLSPWGSTQLHDGKELTVVHHTATVQGAFAVADGESSRTLSINLGCNVACMLSGAGSAKFTADGAALDAPDHGA